MGNFLLAAGGCDHALASGEKVPILSVNLEFRGFAWQTARNSGGKEHFIPRLPACRPANLPQILMEQSLFVAIVNRARHTAQPAHTFHQRQSVD